MRQIDMDTRRSGECRPLTLLPLVWVLAAGLSLGSCSLAPSPEKITVPGDVKNSFAQDHTDRPFEDVSWWKEFNDANLTAIISTTLTQSPDARMAMLNVEAFREQVKISGAPMLPTVAISANGSRTKQNLSTFFPGGGSFKTNSFGLSLSASYELDLWGRLSDTEKSARLALLSSQSARDALFQTVTANVGLLYFQLSEARADLKKWQSLTDLSVALKNNAKQHYTNGTTNGNAFLNSDTQANKARQALTEARHRVTALTCQLNALQGKDPSANITVTSFEKLTNPVNAVPAGLPADLLNRRPDMKQAGLAVRRALLAVGISRSQLLPTLSLTAEGGYKSRELSNLIDPASSVWTLAGGIIQPLFNRGAKRAAVRKARTEARIAVQQYRKQALLAFQDVETALSAYADVRNRFHLEQKNLETARVISERNDMEYRSGTITYQDFLAARIALLQEEISANQAFLAVLTNRIQLFTALGGGISDFEKMTGVHHD